MNTITEETVRELIEQVKQQQAIIAAQEEKILVISNGMRNTSGPKPPKPEIFKGKRDAIEINSWIDQINRYANHYGMTSSQKSDLAVFYLAGAARDWWTNLDENSKTITLQDWSVFSATLKASFYPIDHERKIMDSIERLIQKGSVAKYVEKFEHLRTQVSGVSTDLWKRYFIKGLSKTVKIEAVKYNLDYPEATLTQLYQRTTALGDALWAQRVAQDDPMDLSNVNLVKNNGKNYAGYKENGKASQSTKMNENRTCFKCGKSGHIQKDCRAKIRIQEIECEDPKLHQVVTQAETASEEESDFH